MNRDWSGDGGGGGRSFAQRRGSLVAAIDRDVISKLAGVTKLELVRYYESVAEWMLPHLKGRPCSVVAPWPLRR
jgi:bifunctional non-homologous end joining protein LigD